MKNSLLKILLFVVCFIGIYYFTYLLLFTIKINKEPLIKSVQKELILDKDIFGKVYAEFDPTKKYDILFIGSSHCYRDFNPAIFENEGYTCYNLGSSSQAPLNSYAVLTQTIHTAKQIILEVYPVAGNLSGTEAYYSMACSGIPYSILAPMAMQLNNLRCYNTLSIKPFLDNYNKDKYCTIKEHYKGYVETKDSAKKNIEYEEIELNKVVMDTQLKYVNKIAELCQQNKVNLTLVYAPVPKELKLINEQYYIERIMEIAAAQKITFINSGRNHNLKSHEHFYDDDHLNIAGAKIFNEGLVKMIR